MDDEPAAELLVAQHTPEAVQRRLAVQPRAGHLRDFVYGAVDGTITTFAVVSGVAGAKLSAGIIVVLGLANLLADGFSMAVSNYLGIRAEAQHRQRLRTTERDHIRQHPLGEREEIRQIFSAKGFEGDALERAVDTICSDVDRWIDTMLTDEFGLAPVEPDPLRAAGYTFVAFVAVGAVPLVSFVLALLVPDLVFPGGPFLWSIALTAIAFAAVGAIKSRLVEGSGWRGALEVLLVGGSAAGIAYAIGMLLRGLVE
jgi:VIT1/CCC1 family predicted Fe2+/Mn2+ transporter